MTLETGELLTRLAKTLRSDIGPAVEDDYTRTQAFMAAVILERVARQVDLSPEHAAAEHDDLTLLFNDLRAPLEAAPDDVVSAVRIAEAAADIAALAGVIDALYRWGPDEQAAADMLDRVRQVLRRDIDRRMEVAR